MNNKKRSVSEELTKALEKYVQACGDELLPCDDAVPSEAYRKKMEDLLQRTKKTPCRHLRTIGKRIGGIAAALLVMLGLSMAIRSLRDPIAEYLALHGSTADSSDATTLATPQNHETRYMLKAVPPGYTLVESRQISNGFYHLWTNEMGNFIYIYQQSFDGEAMIDPSEIDYAMGYDADHNTYYSEQFKIKTLAWNTSGYAFYFSTDGDFTFRECLTIAESVTAENGEE